MAQFVDVSVPARPQFLSLVRLALGSVGAQLDLTLEELDDLQLAGEELCLSLLRRPSGPDARLELRLEWEGDAIEVRCRLDGAAARPDGAEDEHAIGEALSEQILDALVDAHGRAAEDGAVIAWLRKRRGERLPAP